MKISIIIPIYKVERFLEQCVESVVNQTYKDLEIILVDDGSPDNCPAICDSWAEKDARIKVIHKKNEGILKARKSGLEAASGDYIGFVDGDDWIERDMYAKIADAVNNYNADCIITQFYYAFENRNEKSTYLLEKPFYSRKDIEEKVFPVMLFADRFFNFGIYPCCWSKVFKRDLLKNNLMNTNDRIRLGEDIAFTFPAIMQADSLAFIDEPLYYYRQNPESVTATYDEYLPTVYNLPFEAVKNAGEEYGVDLSTQLPYYLLYLTNFVIRNEIIKNGQDTNDEVIKRILSYDCLKTELERINPSLLPYHTKLLVKALKSGKVGAVKLYMTALKRFI